MERNNYGNESSTAEQAQCLKSIFPDLDHLDLQELLKQQESAYEFYNFGQPGLAHGESNFGQPGFEHGESSNSFDESGYVDYYDDEALARSLMMLDVEDQFSPPSSPPNTRSNVTEPTVEVHVVENPEQDHDIDPDTMSYEQLQSLGDAVGHESKGLSENAISKLRRSGSSFKAKSSKKKEEIVECTICCAEFNNGDRVITLHCKHFYHSECIIKWLQINKNCPVCQREVPNS
ncbi:RING-type E3 ubiquitin transferase [Salvia divinorum]|uniref:RING-type E3 ubiquitin transferase n=1 Tax=Salvia divinorum TaxID=28513 RepID=A0ABD1FKH2_SALDI